MPVSALSWHPGGYEPPPDPVWSAGPRGPFLYEVPHLPWAHVEGEEEALLVERAAGDEVAIDVSSACGKALVVHEAWYPGWSVEIEGKRAKIEIPKDKVSWRVPIPENAKKAVFRYMPYDFRIGLFVTLATALVCFLVICKNSGTLQNNINFHFFPGQFFRIGLGKNLNPLSF